MKQLKQLCLILLVFAGPVGAAPIVSGNSGNWNNPATWVGAVVPVAGDQVTIANGHSVTITSNAACAAITIGNGLLDQNTVISISAGITLTVTGNITIMAPLSGIIDNLLDINDGTARCSSLITNNSTGNSQRCIVSINTGTLSCSSSFLIGSNITRNKLIFTANGLLQLAGNSNMLADAQFTAATSTIEYNRSSGQVILPLSYYTLRCSGNGNKTLSANTTLFGDLQIAGTAQLDATAANNYSIHIAGSWNVTSTSTDPFIERKSTVTFNGTNGLQVLSTTLTQEPFYTLIINNTAGNAVAGIQFNKNCYVSEAYNHLNGKLNLNGNKLTVVSSNIAGGFVTCALSGGSIVSSLAGAQIYFGDNYDSAYVNITGTNIGNSSFPVSLTINTGRINIENLTLYGAGNFTKTLLYDDVSAKGGNKYHGAVTFNAGATSGNWYTGAGNGALADSFFAKADFFNYINTAGKKFIVGANSAGNYYADSVSITNRHAGSFYIGNSSGAANGTLSSHYFNKIVDVTVAGSGDIVFAEGQSLLPSSVTFNKALRLSSTAVSTGSVYVGKNASGSSITLTGTAQFVTGYIYGATTVYFYNVTQNGALAQTFINAATANSKIIIGHMSGPCTWNGPVTFYATVLDLAYSNFNGSTNTFTLKSAAVSESCTGGNTFAAGTLNFFNNNGTADWYLASSTADDYNGDI
ncbi:MAG: hypothetical protein IPP72_00320 [Chitinophagaceae bacterium]|nr:hypothetical protein [Chitinophagaceae bacterium]